MKTEPIGGYFSLEIANGHQDPPFSGGTLLNSGRACFEYILEVNRPAHVYLPFFTCDVMLSPLEKLDIPYTFYGVNEKLELAQNIELGEDEFLVYVNYFGTKDLYCDWLSERYADKLVLDCSQAFYYAPALNAHTFYSPRKFFGVPDGGILFTQKALERSLDVDVSFERISHLVKRLEQGPQAGYLDFKANDAALREQPIKTMSVLTEQILRGVDYVAARQRRNENFAILHKALQATNSFDYGEIPNGPMSYVYRTTNKELREQLIAKEIFVPTYWPNVFDWCKEDQLEYTLASDLLALPIDQRYGGEDMKRIVEAINGR